MAKIAVDRKTGARGLRGVLEDVMMGMMFEIPSDEAISHVTINAQTIRREGKPVIERRHDAPRSGKSA